MIEKTLITEAHLLELPSDKSEAIRAAVDALAGKCGQDADAIYESVLKREEVMSTGMGHGVAIPHAKIAGLDGFKLSISRSKDPIDYQSLDSTPVRIFALLLSPEGATKDHVKMIAEVTKRLKFSSVRQAILDATTPKEMEKAFLNQR